MLLILEMKVNKGRKFKSNFKHISEYVWKEMMAYLRIEMMVLKDKTFVTLIKRPEKGKVFNF